MKERYGQSNVRFILGKHFTRSSLSSPTKARLKEKVTGRYIYDLALTVIKNLKKASSIAEEWLDDDGNLPSGKNWDDLYDYVISQSHEISKEKNTYTGWIAMEVLTKYNPDGNNHISALTSDGNITDNNHRVDFRKNKKARNVGSPGHVDKDAAPYQERGLSLNTRLNVIEMVQIEDEKASVLT